MPTIEEKDIIFNTNKVQESDIVFDESLKKREPGLYQAPEPTFVDKFIDIFREKPEKQRARAQNAMAMSEVFGVSPSQAYDLEPELRNSFAAQTGLALEMTPSQFYSGLLLPPIAMGLSTAPIATFIGIARFEAFGEGESAVINYIKGTKYKAFQQKGFSDFLPEDINTLTKNTVDTVDFLAKAIVSGKGFKYANKAPEWEMKFAKDVLVEHKAPQKFYIDPADIRKELQVGGILSAEELNIIKELTGSHSKVGTENAIKVALRKGISIEVPAERVTIIRDKPWYARIKKLFKIDPAQESRIVETEGAKKQGFGKEEIKVEPKSGDFLTLVNEATGEFAIRSKEIAGMITETGKKLAEPLKGEAGFVEFGKDKREAIRKKIIENKLAGRDAFEGVSEAELGFVQKEALKERVVEPVSKDRIKELEGKKINAINVDEATELVIEGRNIKSHLEDALQEGKNYDVIRNDMRELLTSKLAEDKTLTTAEKSRVEGKLDQQLADAYEKFLIGEKPEIKPIEKKPISKVKAVVIREKKITKEKIEELKRTGELTQLRQRIKDRFNFIKRGIREGTIQTKKDIKAIQNEVVDIVDTSDLEAKDRAKFIRKIKNIQTKAQLEKAMPAIEEKVNKLIEASTKRSIAQKIMKPVGIAHDFKYRQAIEHIQELIDPAIRTERTMKRNEQLREFIAKNEDANIPVKTLKKLLKTPLNELSVDELNDINEEVARLRQLGKLKYELKKNKREREINEAIEGVVENSTKGEGLTEKEQKVLVHATTEKGFVDISKKAGRYFRAITLRMPRITRLLEGKEGEAFKWFVSKVNKAIDTTLINSDTRYEAMNKLKAGLGIDTKKLAETREIDGIQFSIDEIIDIYIGEKNPRKKLAIWYGNNISPELMDKIIIQMTPQEKALGDAILKDHLENQERLRESVIENENRDMGIEENYSSMKRRDIDYKTPKDQILNELLHRSALKKGYVEKGFTIPRKEIPDEYQMPIKLGAYSAWLQQVALQEEYINLMGLTKDLHKIAENPTFQAAVELRLGKEYIDRFGKYVSRVANPHIYRSFEGWENVSRELRGNVVLAYLAGNFVTMGKQLPSVFLYLPEAGLNHWTQSVTEFLENPVKLIHKIKSLDPQVKHRSIERELEELKNLKADTLYRKGKTNARKYGLMGIRALDMIAITIGENAVYKRYLSEGFSEEDALKKAQQVTLDTQPQAHPKDLPEIYASNEMLNWFLQFTNQLNQIYQLTTVDYPQYAKNKEWIKVFYGSVAMSMVALTIWSMTHKALPDDEDDVIDAFTDQALNAIPLFGKTLQQKINGPDYGGEIPITKNIGDIGKAIKQGYEGKYEDMAKSTLRGISPIVGNPYIFEDRTYNALETGDIKELIGKKKIKGRKKITIKP